MMHIDVEALGASLERLRGTPHETDVARALQRVVSSVDRLFGYDGAGIMLIDQKEQLLSIVPFADGRAAFAPPRSGP
ncbi:hypothetical protein [Actinomadura chokoriensis]|uniref:hypothetical protein n=1 Tax=Actinomadura chokoriensis TaxID=454156 RepID=UPI0031F7ABE9